VEGGLILEYTISLEYKLPPQILHERYVHFQSSCLHKNTKASWSPYIREGLPVQREVNNIHDDFAVAVLKNSNTVGHVPREISRDCWYFLHKSGSEMTCSHKLTKDSLCSTHLQQSPDHANRGVV